MVSEFPVSNPQKASPGSYQPALLPTGPDASKPGFKFKWHDFDADQIPEWAETSPPGALEVCVNLEGSGRLEMDGATCELAPRSMAFWFAGREKMARSRRHKECHQFLTVGFSRTFLLRHLESQMQWLHPAVRGFLLDDRAAVHLEPSSPMTNRQIELGKSLRHPPPLGPAQPLWYHGKSIELLVEFLFRDPNQELFCARQHRTARERVERAIGILRQDLSEPPSLEELGRRVGCSPFYLSRTFSREVKMTIPQYLRRLRMEKAAELLQSGRCNVTEAALEVGYSSLSHFSQAFCQVIGCCPNLYPQGKPSPQPSPARRTAEG